MERTYDDKPRGKLALSCFGNNDRPQGKMPLPFCVIESIEILTKSEVEVVVENISAVKRGGDRTLNPEASSIAEYPRELVGVSTHGVAGAEDFGTFKWLDGLLFWLFLAFGLGNYDGELAVDHASIRLGFRNIFERFWIYAKLHGHLRQGAFDVKLGVQ